MGREQIAENPEAIEAFAKHRVRLVAFALARDGGLFGIGKRRYRGKKVPSTRTFDRCEHVIGRMSGIDSRNDELHL
ncbi:MAG: hypothetical protein Q4E80_04510 [Slackia faecicanis]|nr:hypothetical protein [Slackia faecicanis]